MKIKREKDGITFEGTANELAEITLCLAEQRFFKRIKIRGVVYVKKSIRRDE